MTAGTAKSKRVAVTGSGGFLGRSVVVELRRRGVPVCEFTRERPAITAGGLVAEALDHCGAVIHLATRVNPKLAEEDAGAVAADEADFALLLAHLARRRGGDEVTVLLPSSGGTVYDPDVNPPHGEASPCRPVNVYGRLRLRLEGLLRSAGDPIRPRILRLSNVYGPGQHLGTGQGVIGHWLEAASRGAPIQLYGDPDACRDYVYIDDVVSAMLLVVGDQPPGPALPDVINVGSGRPTSLRTLVDAIRRVVAPASIEVQEMDARSFDRHDSWLDISVAQRRIGWRPTTGLEVGLRRTWEAWGGPGSPPAST